MSTKPSGVTAYTARIDLEQLHSRFSAAIAAVRSQ
jgi:hypothetical protein